MSEHLVIEDEDLLGTGAVEFSDRWRRDLTRLWRDARAVIVQHMSNPESKKGFKKIQKIVLPVSKNRSTPNVDIDDVVEAIAESVHGWLKIRHEDGHIGADDLVHFAVEVQRLVGKSDAPSRSKFYISATLGGSHEDVYDSVENEALSELERQRQVMIDQLQKTVDTQSVHIENLNEVVIKLATISQAPMEAAAEFMKMANHIALQGMQSQLIASKMEYDLESVKIQERERSKRHEYWMESAGKYVLPYIPSAVTTILAKMSGDSTKVATPPPTTSADLVDDEESEEEALQRFDEEWGERLNAFKASLDGKQMGAINDGLSRQEQGPFWKTVGASSFTEAIGPYQELCDIADFGALIMTLQEIFTPEQQQFMLAFHTEYCRYLSALEEQQKNAGSEEGGADANE